MANLTQSNEYDIVPSAMSKGYMNYTTELITADYAFSESLLNKVDKSCRKHGINCIISKSYSNSYQFMFFVSVDNRSMYSQILPERDRLMDCIHELDNRTPLNFHVEADTNHYIGAFPTPTKKILECVSSGKVKEFIYSHWDPEKQETYLTVFCKYVNVPYNMTMHLVDTISEISTALLRNFTAWGYDTVIRLMKPDARELRMFVSLDGIVTCCRYEFRFHENPEETDCSIYAMEYADGKFRYVLIDKNGFGYVDDETTHLHDLCIYNLITRYIRGKLELTYGTEGI